MLVVLVKKYIQKLKTTLLYKNLIDNYHFIVILLIISGLSYYYKNILLFIILLIYTIYLFIKNHFLAYVSIFIFSLFVFGLVINEVSYKNAILGEKRAYIKIIEREVENNGYKFIIKCDNHKYLVYSEENYLIGDVLYVNGTFNKIDSNHIQGLFNYQEYCKYQKLIIG